MSLFRKKNWTDRAYTVDTESLSLTQTTKREGMNVFAFLKLKIVE